MQINTGSTYIFNQNVKQNYLDHVMIRLPFARSLFEDENFLKLIRKNKLNFYIVPRSKLILINDNVTQDEKKLEDEQKKYNTLDLRKYNDEITNILEIIFYVDELLEKNFEQIYFSYYNKMKIKYTGPLSLMIIKYITKDEKDSLERKESDLEKKWIFNRLKKGITYINTLQKDLDKVEHFLSEESIKRYSEITNENDEQSFLIKTLFANRSGVVHLNFFDIKTQTKLDSSLGYNNMFMSGSYFSSFIEEEIGLQKYKSNGLSPVRTNQSFLKYKYGIIMEEKNHLIILRINLGFSLKFFKALKESTVFEKYFLYKSLFFNHESLQITLDSYRLMFPQIKLDDEISNIGVENAMKYTEMEKNFYKLIFIKYLLEIKNGIKDISRFVKNNLYTKFIGIIEEIFATNSFYDVVNWLISIAGSFRKEWSNISPARKLIKNIEEQIKTIKNLNDPTFNDAIIYIESIIKEFNDSESSDYFYDEKAMKKNFILAFTSLQGFLGEKNYYETRKVLIDGLILLNNMLRFGQMTIPIDKWNDYTNILDRITQAIFNITLGLRKQKTCYISLRYKSLNELMNTYNRTLFAFEGMKRMRLHYSKYYQDKISNIEPLILNESYDTKNSELIKTLRKYKKDNKKKNHYLKILYGAIDIYNIFINGIIGMHKTINGNYFECRICDKNNILIDIPQTPTKSFINHFISDDHLKKFVEKFKNVLMIKSIDKEKFLIFSPEFKNNFESYDMVNELKKFLEYMINFNLDDINKTIQDTINPLLKSIPFVIQQKKIIPKKEEEEEEKKNFDIENYDNYKPKGLNNFALNCYSNSVVQLLFLIFTIKKAKYPHNTSIDYIKKLFELYQEYLKHNNQDEIYTKNRKFVRSIINKYSNKFTLGRYQDAPEFLEHILDDSNKVFDMGWKFKIINKIKCGNKYEENKPSQTSYIFQVSLPESVTEISTLQKLIDKEDSIPELRITSCGDTPITSKNIIIDSPEFLFIQLKRFSYKINVGPKKLYNLIYSNPNIKITSTNNIKYFYELIGRIKHHEYSLTGNPNIGHYIANIKYNNNWYLIDDTTATPITLNQGDFDTIDDYILLYKKV